MDALPNIGELFGFSKVPSWHLKTIRLFMLPFDIACIIVEFLTADDAKNLLESLSYPCTKRAQMELYDCHFIQALEKLLLPNLASGAFSLSRSARRCGIVSPILQRLQTAEMELDFSNSSKFLAIRREYPHIAWVLKTNYDTLYGIWLAIICGVSPLGGLVDAGNPDSDRILGRNVTLVVRGIPMSSTKTIVAMHRKFLDLEFVIEMSYAREVEGIAPLKELDNKGKLKKVLLPVHDTRALEALPTVWPSSSNLIASLDPQAARLHNFSFFRKMREANPRFDLTAKVANYNLREFLLFFNTDVRLHFVNQFVIECSTLQPGQGLEIVTALKDLRRVIDQRHRGLDLSLLKKLFLHNENPVNWLQEEKTSQTSNLLRYLVRKPRDLEMVEAREDLPNFNVLIEEQRSPRANWDLRRL